MELEESGSSRRTTPGIIAPLTSKTVPSMTATPVAACFSCSAEAAPAKAAAKERPIKSLRTRRKHDANEQVMLSTEGDSKPQIGGSQCFRLSQDSVVTSPCSTSAWVEGRRPQEAVQSEAIRAE